MLKNKSNQKSIVFKEAEADHARSSSYQGITKLGGQRNHTRLLLASRFSINLRLKATPSVDFRQPTSRALNKSTSFQVSLYFAYYLMFTKFMAAKSITRRLSRINLLKPIPIGINFNQQFGYPPYQPEAPGDPTL